MVVLIKPWDVLKEMAYIKVGLGTSLDWCKSLDDKLPDNRIITIEVEDSRFAWQSDDDSRSIWKIYEEMIEKVIEW